MMPDGDVAARLEALERRVGEFDDIDAIRRLHWAYGCYIDFKGPDDVAELFARDGSVVFLSDEYHGRAGVRQTWPHRQDVPMHFAHPRFGAMLAREEQA